MKAHILFLSIISGLMLLVFLMANNRRIIKRTQESTGMGPATPMPLLHAAARAGDLEDIERLVALGADINLRDNEGNAPLYYAVTLVEGKDKSSVVERLLALGADACLKNYAGRTVHDYIITMKQLHRSNPEKIVSLTKLDTILET